MQVRRRVGAHVARVVLATVTCPVMAALICLVLAGPAWAHGGQYSNPPLYRPGRNVGPGPTVPGPTPRRGPPTPKEVTPSVTSSTTSRLGPDDWQSWWLSQRGSLLAGRFVGATTPSPRERVSTERQRVLDVLLLAADHDNEDIATSALVALGRLGAAAAEAPLVATLRDASKTQSVREAAACGLALLGQRPDSEAPRHALESVAMASSLPSRLRAIAAHALGLRGEKESQQLLSGLAASTSTDADVSAAAASALGLANASGSVWVLDRLLEKGRPDDPDSGLVRAYAAHGLAAAESTSSLPLLRRMISDDDPLVRKSAMLAATALSARDDAVTERELRRRLDRDKDVSCRDVAVLCLGRLGHARSEKVLLDAWQGGRAVHRTYAATALGLWARKRGDTKACIPVRRALSGSTPLPLRGAATVALAVARDRASGAFLISAVEGHGDAGVRALAASVLPEITDRADAAPVLRRLLASGVDPQVRREAARALGALGDVESTPALIKVIESEDSLYERASATVALGRIGGPGSVDRLLKILETEANAEMLRALAAVSLGILLEHENAQPLHAVATDLYWGVTTESVSELLTIL